MNLNPGRFESQVFEISKYATLAVTRHLSWELDGSMMEDHGAPKFVPRPGPMVSIRGVAKERVANIVCRTAQSKK